MLSVAFSIGNAQSFLGQWYSSEDDSYLIIDSESIVIISGLEDFNCYDFDTTSYVDSANFLIISFEDTISFPVEFQVFSDTLFLLEEDTITYIANNTDVSTLTNCQTLYNWSCEEQGCVEVAAGSGDFISQEECAEICSPTSLFNLLPEKFYVYPSPIKDRALIYVNGKPTMYKVYTMDAKCIESKTISTNIIEFTRGDLPSGTYFLEIVEESKVLRKKIILH